MLTVEEALSEASIALQYKLFEKATAFACYANALTTIETSRAVLNIAAKQLEIAKAVYDNTESDFA